MYGREYGDKALNFEASGGLIHASLILADKETDTFWSIMTHDALAGELAGERLQTLPFGVKAQWKDWKAEHPNTLILSVDGKEHIFNNPYDNYFKSDKTFMGGEVKDTRLKAKAPIYGFQRGDSAHAVPFASFQGDGADLEIGGGGEIFLYRPDGVEIFYSTHAFFSPKGFEKRDGSWVEIGSGARFDADAGGFVGEGGSSIESLGGFDTFWFNWSMNNPSTKLLQ